MYKPLLCIFLALVLSIAYPQSAHAQSIGGLIQKQDITFDIQQDNSVKQTTIFTFSRPSNNTLNYTISNKVDSITVSDTNSTFQYELIPNGDYYILQIFLDKPTTTLKISYTVNDIVFQSDSIRNFFTQFTFNSTIQSIKVKVLLPVGYGVYHSSYLPGDGTVASDGTRITITWDKTNVKGTVLYSVQFQNLNSSSSDGIWLLAIAVLAGGGLYLYFHFKKKTKEEFIKGFREDEQKVIGYLEKHKKTFQNKIQKEFNFSRAKATRIMMVRGA